MNTYASPWENTENNGNSAAPESTTPGRICSTYGPGHEVFWARALHYTNKPRTPRTGSLVGYVDDSITIEWDANGSRQTFFSHDRTLLKRALEQLTLSDPEIIYDGDFLTFRGTDNSGKRTGVHLNPLTQQTPCDYAFESETTTEM